MGLGALANPGISSGVLTGDVIDKMKAQDLRIFVERYDPKLEMNGTRQKDLAELQTKLSALQSALSALADAGSFTKRTVSQSGDKDVAELVVGSGVSLGKMDIEVKELAQRDIYQSKGIKDTNEAILSGSNLGKVDASFTLTIGEESFEIKLDETSTYKDMVEKINSATDGKIQAKLLNTGEPGAPYRLSLSSKETGTDNTIGFFAGKKTTNQNGKIVYEETAAASELLKNLGWEVDKSQVNQAGGYTIKGGEGKINIDSTNTVNSTSTIGSDFSFTLVGKGGNYQIDVKANMTYEELAKEIGKKTKGEYSASISNSGTFSIKAEGANTEVRLVDGVADPDNPNIFKTNNAATDFFKNNLGWDIEKSKTTTLNSYTLSDPNNDLHMSTATNAKFSYDGVEMTRQSNTIKDLGVGITLTLEKVGKVNFSIGQDAGEISKSMEDFVNAYNDLMLNVSAATDYNAETGTQGSLQGVAEINSLSSRLNKVLFGTTEMVEGKELDKNGNEIKTKVILSLTSFGLSMEKNGTLKFKQGEFEDMLNKDIKQAENFFAGFADWSAVSLSSDPSKIKLDPADIKFKKGDFTLTYGGKTIDLYKDKDGNEFTLTGADEKTKMSNLVAHINSLDIEGVSAKVTKVNYQGQDKYVLKIEGEGGADLAIGGKKDFLEKFGLSEAKSISEMEKETGVFSKLKNELKSLTKDNGAITSYSDFLTRESKDLQKDKEDAKKMIDKKYDLMTEKWIQYERILAKLNSQQNAVVSAINAMNNQGN